MSIPYLLSRPAMLLLCVLFFSCEKEEVHNGKQNANEKTTAHKNNGDQTHDQANGQMDEPFKFHINREDLADNVAAMVDESFNEDFLAKHPDASARISPLNSNKFTIIIDPNGHDGPMLKEVVCEGSGIPFARCVRAWLQENPDGCLVITQEDGTYFANDEGCDSDG